VASLAGRILVGYAVDLVSKKTRCGLLFLDRGVYVVLLMAARVPTVVWELRQSLDSSRGAITCCVSLGLQNVWNIVRWGNAFSADHQGYSLGQWISVGCGEDF